MNYRQRKQLSQIPEHPGQAPRGWGKGDEKEAYRLKLEAMEQAQQQVQAEQQFNARVDRRQQLGEQFDVPPALRNDYTRAMGDRIVDAEMYLQSPQFRDQATIAAALGGTVLAGKAGADFLGAMNDQQRDEMPTDVFSVGGRMVNNAKGIGGYGVVGVDPLAAARNNVSQARELVGSEAMLEALLVDEINSMQQAQSAGASLGDIEQMNVIQQAIDRRAKQLQADGEVRNADGSVTPMSWDDAQRFATNQVEMDLKGTGLL